MPTRNSSPMFTPSRHASPNATRRPRRQSPACRARPGPRRLDRGLRFEPGGGSAGCAGRRRADLAAELAARPPAQALTSTACDGHRPGTARRAPRPARRSSGPVRRRRRADGSSSRCRGSKPRRCWDGPLPARTRAAGRGPGTAAHNTGDLHLARGRPPAPTLTDCWHKPPKQPHSLLYRPNGVISPVTGGRRHSLADTRRLVQCLRARPTTKLSLQLWLGGSDSV